MKKKKVLITGVTGTMGFATLKQFAAHLDEFDVRVLARKSDFNENMLKPYAEQIEIVWGDLTDDECLHECVKDMDYILAIGAFVSPMADAHPEECIRTNYGSTLSMLRSIKELGQTDKTHFVFIGSVSMYGDRQTPIHWAKVGDPLKSSILDHYALGKIFSERAVIDSGLKHWASIRQTGMYPTNIHNITVGYPIRSHIPLNNVCEWSDCDDSARLMFNICASAPEKFWNHCYNLGGGADYRKTQLEHDKLNGLDRSKIADTNWYALYNHHCVWFLDSDNLQELVPFREKPFEKCVADSRAYLAEKFKEIGYTLKPKTDEEKRQKNFEDFSKWGGTLWALNQEDPAYMQAFYGSKKKYDAIPKDWETYYKRGIIPEEYNQIELGFDQNKPVEELDIEDMRQAAAFRGGECLSETMEKGQLYKKLRWRCACGHEFEGTPYAILFAGHWCEDCMGAEWRYGDMADENPFFAQVWKPLHADDENFVVKTEFDPRIVKNKYEE